MPLLNERARRMFVASEAHSAGRGASSQSRNATGVARSTISRGADGTPCWRAGVIVAHPPARRWSQAEDRDRAWPARGARHACATGDPRRSQSGSALGQQEPASSRGCAGGAWFQLNIKPADFHAGMELHIHATNSRRLKQLFWLRPLVYVTASHLERARATRLIQLSGVLAPSWNTR